MVTIFFIQLGTCLIRAKEMISRVVGPVRACPATSVPLRLAASITVRWQTQELTNWTH